MGLNQRSIREILNRIPMPWHLPALRMWRRELGEGWTVEVDRANSLLCMEYSNGARVRVTLGAHLCFDEATVRHLAQMANEAAPSHTGSEIVLQVSMVRGEGEMTEPRITISEGPILEV